MCAMMEELRMWAGSMQVEHEIIACRRQADLKVRLEAPEAMPSRTRRGLPLIERYEPLWIVGTDIVGTWTDQAIVRVLLQHVRRPSGHPAHRENRRVEIDRNAERVVGGRGIEIDVRVQLLLRLDERLDALRHLAPRGVAGALAELLRHLPQVRRPRILGAIHAVPEARNL